jgi:hypothetical protein
VRAQCLSRPLRESSCGVLIVYPDMCVCKCVCVCVCVCHGTHTHTNMMCACEGCRESAWEGESVGGVSTVYKTLNLKPYTGLNAKP